MILVTGATGHVGAELVGRLAGADAPADTPRVRAMTRRPEAAAAALAGLDAEVEVVRADAEEPASLDGAFAGVRRAFLMSAQPVGTAGERPTHVPRLVDAAVRAGVERVVLLSVYGGGNGTDVIADWSGRIEDAVTGSGLDWTLLRPGRFMSNALAWAPMIRRGDEVTIPFAHCRGAPTDPADIAAVAAAALTGDGHRGAIYQISGPEVLTPAEELAVLAQLLGRPLRPVEPPLDVVRAGMHEHGIPDDVLDAIVARTLRSDEGSQLLPTVALLLNRAPRTFAQWAAAHLTEFTA